MRNLINNQTPTGALDDLRVLELGGIRGEFCGKLLAGHGADVIRIEPPDGDATRRIGPFYHDDPHPERSLYWWHYNLGKRGITLNLETADGRALFRSLVATADVVLESYRPGYLEGLGIGYRDLTHLPTPDARSPVWLSITDFGQTGPYRDYQATDLNLLAIGGQMAVSGYSPDKDGNWDTPPIAPQMWHAYHIGGNIAFLDLLAALLYRDDTGRGQYLDISIHEACNNCTEPVLPWYLYGGRVARRQRLPGALARDGVEVRIMPPLFPGEFEKFVQMLDDDGMAEDLTDPYYADPHSRRDHEVTQHIQAVAARYIEAHDAGYLFHNAQRCGVVWCPIRAPEDNLDDRHFWERGALVEVEHPELGQSFTYAGQPRISEAMPWRLGPRAPLLGEHNRSVYMGELGLSRGAFLALAEAGVF